ncbi:unnamed protein product, partial [marine sediment metagenome]
WDNFAWLPGGEKLAISRLNGRDKSEGSTLYIIAGDSGAIEQSYELEYAYDQNAANIKWLTNTELLIRSLIALAGLFLLNLMMRDPLMVRDGLPPWLGYPIGISFYVTLILTVVMAAVLITSGLQQASASTENTAILNHARRKMILRFGLAVILLGYLAYTILWGSIWDQTSDGIFGVAVSIQAGGIAVGAGMVMAVVLNGKRRAAGLLFALLVPIVMFQSFEIGWQVSYHELTENRAARIERALARYQKREGAYPDTLRALTPIDLLYIQQPVILASEEWCYQGGE